MKAFEKSQRINAGHLLMRYLIGRRAIVPVSQRLRHLALLIENFGVADVEGSGERAVLEHLRQQRSSTTQTVFDVGANRGAYTDLVLKLLPDAQVHAFEPNPAVYEQLKTRFASEPRVRCLRLALGAYEGRAVLYGIAGEPANSSLSGLSSLTKRDLRDRGHSMDAVAEVEVGTADSYCKQNGITRIDLLKLDTEGHELDVLAGAEGILQSGTVNAVQFEFGGANLDTRTFLRDFVRLLEPEFQLFRVLRDGLGLLLYSEREEIFVTSNYYAARRSP
jgi:FkbM family methyltransferase